MGKNQENHSVFVARTIRIIAFVTITAVIQLKPVLWMIATKHHIIERNYLLQSPLSIKWRVPDILTLNTTIKWQMKSTVFHQLNISHISFSQADSPRLPKITYGIRLKGSSFLKTASFSLNFLRSRYERAFTQKKKKVRYLSGEKRSEFSQDTATFQPRCCSKVCLRSKMWANLRHRYLPFSSWTFKEIWRGGWGCTSWDLKTFQGCKINGFNWLQNGWLASVVEPGAWRTRVCRLH